MTNRNSDSWAGSYPAPQVGPPPQSPNNGGGVKGIAIFGAFAASIGAGVATAVQGMAGILGLAYDSPLPDPTPVNEFFGVVFIVLYISTFVSAVLTVVAFTLSIIAVAQQSAKLMKWVYVIFVVVFALCIGTWASGIASIPS